MRNNHEVWSTLAVASPRSRWWSFTLGHSETPLIFSWNSCLYNYFLYCNSPTNHNHTKVESCTDDFAITIDFALNEHKNFQEERAVTHWQPMENKQNELPSTYREESVCICSGLWPVNNMPPASLPPENRWMKHAKPRTSISTSN